jgi:uncharacterized membrane protein YphA (DoxX/SURF4 family)
MQWLLALVYLSAGWSKLHNSGVQWLNGYTLTYHFFADAVRTGSAPAQLLASLPPRLLVPIGVGAVLFELTFWVAIVVPRTAWLYVLAGTAMHLSIFVIQRAPFFQTIILYAVFAEAARRYGPHALRVVATRRPRWRWPGHPVERGLEGERG